MSLILRLFREILFTHVPCSIIWTMKSNSCPITHNEHAIKMEEQDFNFIFLNSPKWYVLVLFFLLPISWIL